MIRPVPSGLSAAAAFGVHPPYEEILNLACRAPSVHNTQPWRWWLDDDRLHLFADYSRQLEHADADGRDLLLSCGAVLHHLQVVTAGFGWSARVRRVPDPADPAHIATVWFTASTRSAQATALLRAVRERRTDRRRFTSWPIPADRLHGLAATGSHWGAQVLPVAGEAVRSQLRRLTIRADHIQRRNPGYLHELRAWVRSGRDGLPPQLLPSAESAVAEADLLNRRFPSGTLSDPVLSSQGSADAMLLVCTSSDDLLSRIRAGEAMSAVWLRATDERLSVVPLTQALEVEETRQELERGILGGLARAQILLRVGWLPVSRSEVARTPRRPLSEVLAHASG